MGSLAGSGSFGYVSLRRCARLTDLLITLRAAWPPFRADQRLQVPRLLFSTVVPTNLRWPWPWAASELEAAARTIDQRKLPSITFAS